MVKAAKRILTKLLKTLLRSWISAFLHLVWRKGCLRKRAPHVGITVPSCTFPSPAPILGNIGCACPLSGILKFHEHYLGDSTVESAGDFQAGSSAALPAATSSALEQHIASVREALGVESYYSRQVAHCCRSRVQIQSLGLRLWVFCKYPTGDLLECTSVAAAGRNVSLEYKPLSGLCLFFLVVSLQTGKGLIQNAYF